LLIVAGVVGGGVCAVGVVGVVVIVSVDGEFGHFGCGNVEVVEYVVNMNVSGI